MWNASEGLLWILGWLSMLIRYLYHIDEVNGCKELIIYLRTKGTRYRNPHVFLYNFVLTLCHSDFVSKPDRSCTYMYIHGSPKAHTPHSLTTPSKLLWFPRWRWVSPALTLRRIVPQNTEKWTDFCSAKIVLNILTPYRFALMLQKSERISVCIYVKIHLSETYTNFKTASLYLKGCMRGYRKVNGFL